MTQQPPRQVSFAADATLDQIAVGLPLQQARVLALLRPDIDGGYVTARQIRERAGFTSPGNTHAIYGLGSKLLKTRWNLDIKRGTAARPDVETYRLVTVADR